MTVPTATGAGPVRDRVPVGLAHRRFHRSNRVPDPRNPSATTPRRGSHSNRRHDETMTKSSDGSLHKHIRVSREQWERIERAAQGTPHSPNQVLVELAMEALDRRNWPGTETEIKVARASLFAAQAIARRLIADGREDEVQEIRQFISSIVPDARDE